MCQKAEEEDQESQPVLTESLWRTVVWYSILQGTQVWTKTKQNTHYKERAVVSAVSVVGKLKDAETIQPHLEIILIKISTLIPDSKRLYPPYCPRRTSTMQSGARRCGV